MSKDFVKLITSEFEPRPADITVGESMESFNVSCKPCAKPNTEKEGVAAIHPAKGKEFLTAVVEAIADKEEALEYLQALEADLRDRCENTQEQANVAEIMSAVEKKLDRP